MQVQFKNLNRLPAATWNKMGVNGGGAEFTFAPPEPLRGGGLPAAAAGVSVAAIETCGENLPDAPVEQEALAFAKAHRNAGYFVKTAAGVKTAKPLVFDYSLGKNQPAVVDENVVLAGEGSEITAVLHYSGEGFHGGVTRLFAAKNAVVRLIVLQTLGSASENLSAIAGTAEEGARIELITAELGAQKTYTDCRVRLDGDGSIFDIGTLYLGDGTRSVDIGILAEHNGKKTVSNIDVHGALLDESRKIFRGTIDFKKGSAGSRGRESENTLLLGRHVRNRTAPLILCAEEDVDGRHAATCGRIDENRMFYLMSRGLSREEVKKLMIEAEFAPITAKIPVESYRNEISALLERRIENV